MSSHALDIIHNHLLALPALAKFALGMAMLVTIPRLCRRLHFPVAVGLLLGGVIVGPHVLGFFGTDRPIADFLAELGKLLLMFFVGLEIDLALFRRARNRSIAFGIATTIIPLVLGTAVAAVGGSPQAQARALHVRGSSPAVDAIIRGGHAEYVVRFNWPVDHIASRLEIVQSGRVIRTLIPRVDSAVDVLFASGESPLAGDYLLGWRAVSPDGEVSAGDIAFSVAP